MAESGTRSWAPRAERATRLILVRHCETDHSVERRFSGRSDPALTERGQAQALAAAVRVAALVAAADVPPHLISSPLTRARQTAEEIASLIRVEVDIEPGLAECDFGEWEGLTFQEARERWPDELQAWLGSTGVPPPSGESMDDVAARVLPVAARIRSSCQGATVVAVSHVTGIKLLLRDALDGGAGFLHQLHLDPGGISIVDSWPDGGVSVRLVNDVSHLGEIVT